MINYIWSGTILISIFYGGINKGFDKMTEELVNSSGEAVSMCIVMLGTLCLWSGLMEVAKESGIVSGMTRLIMPFIDFMYPQLSDEMAAKEYIAVNMVANIFGIGQAATQSGLKAMEELKRISKQAEIASDSMCVFVILNISSLQLIPVNMIAYRQKYGSANPTIIIGPAILATFISTLCAVVFCWILYIMRNNNACNNAG